MKARIASIFLAAFCTVMPAFAQAPPAMPELTTGQMDAAHELLKITNVESVMRGSMGNQAEMIEQKIKKIAPDADPQVIALVERIAHEETEKNIPRIIEDSAKIYARHFSKQDLRDLIAFYKTPLGSKLIIQLPQITREVTQMSADVASNMMVRVLQELKKLKAPGQTP